MKKENLIIILLIVAIILISYNSVVLTKNNCKKQEDTVPLQQNLPLVEQNISTVNPFENADLKVEIIKNTDGTFGYQVLYNSSAMVSQPNIPGMPGNAGFTTKEKAEKVGDLIVSKIKKNQMPPTVSIQELDSLKVL